jgi:hypothetical protein
LHSGLYVCKAALYCLSYITSPFTILIFSVDLSRGLPVPLKVSVVIPSFPGATSIGTHCKWESFSNLSGLGQTHCFSNETRVWSSRSIISFRVNSKVWVRDKGLDAFVWASE